MQGGTVFDAATWTGGGGATTPGSRAHPPYNAEWEKIYSDNVALKDKERFPDPNGRCGIQMGFPRIFNVGGPIEFIVRPEQVWFLTENTPNIMRVYTDGRKLYDDPYPTYTGQSVGHWEGDTLVFETNGIKGWRDKDVVLDRSGLVLSDAASAVTRIRKTDPQTISVQMTIQDPKALTRPWVVTKTFRKMAADTWIFDYACAENNRNVVDERTGETLYLDAQGKPVNIGGDEQ
jgi:hypothetical protein